MESLLTAEEAAEILGVSKAQIRQWTYEESIPNVRVGRSVRFRQEEIEDWSSKKGEKGSGKRTEDRIYDRVDTQERREWEKDYRKIKDFLATFMSDLKKGERSQS